MRIYFCINLDVNTLNMQKLSLYFMNIFFSYIELRCCIVIITVSGADKLPLIINFCKIMNRIKYRFNNKISFLINKTPITFHFNTGQAV